MTKTKELWPAQIRNVYWLFAAFLFVAALLGVLYDSSLSTALSFVFILVVVLFVTRMWINTELKSQITKKEGIAKIVKWRETKKLYNILVSVGFGAVLFAFSYFLFPKFYALSIAYLTSPFLALLYLSRNAPTRIESLSQDKINEMLIGGKILRYCLMLFAPIVFDICYMILVMPLATYLIFVVAYIVILFLLSLMVRS